MSANLQIFLLCGVLPVTVAILLGAWQNSRRARKRREMRLAAQAALVELKHQQARLVALHEAPEPTSERGWLWRSVPTHGRLPGIPASKPLGGTK